MAEKAILVATLFAVLAVGLIAVAGLSNMQAVAVIQTTTFQEKRMCACQIEQFDFTGLSMGREIHQVRARTRQAHTNEACNTRCGTMYGRGSRRIVTGWAI